MYAVCLRRGCVNAVGCHFVEKHYGLGLHRMGWGGLGLGAGLQVSDWVAAESSCALRPRPTREALLVLRAEELREEGPCPCSYGLLLALGG